MPRPPAAETAAARGAVEVCAIPARRMGCRMRRSVVRGVVRVGVEDAMVRFADAYGVGWLMDGVICKMTSDGSGLKDDESSVSTTRDVWELPWRVRNVQ